MVNQASEAAAASFFRGDRRSRCGQQTLPTDCRAMMPDYKNAFYSLTSYRQGQSPGSLIGMPQTMDRVDNDA